jgi:hypothetical protein
MGHSESHAYCIQPLALPVSDWSPFSSIHSLVGCLANKCLPQSIFTSSIAPSANTYNIAYKRVGFTELGSGWVDPTGSYHVFF